MGVDRELAMVKRVLEKMQIQMLHFDRSHPPQVDLGLRSSMHLLDLKDDRFQQLRHNVMYSVDDALLCHYNMALLPNSSEVLLIGPYLLHEITEQQLLALMERHRLPSGTKNVLRHYYRQLSVVQPNDSLMLSLLETLCETLWGESGGFETLSVENGVPMDSLPAFDDTTLIRVADAADLKLMEARYDAENRLMYAVSHGMSHQARMLISKAGEHVVEKRTMDALRNLKNYGVVLNTLLRKAAEQGDVHPLYIDKLSSSMALRLEQASSTAACLELYSTMVHKYCLLVKNHSMRHFSQLVQHVILRVESDLTADLSLKAHAEFLNVNPSYLSTLFKRETGVTLTEYVNRQRVEHGIFLLNSTDLQVQTIAQHCGIPDINYFTKVFKRIIGQTPKAYRQSVRGV